MTEFWKTKKLSELNNKEWESLCDRCGKCCVIKLIDESTEKLYYTKVSCKLLNTNNCSCKNYPNRKKLIPDCVELNADNIKEFNWLPKTCAYRLIDEGKDLPEWHPLIQKNRRLMDESHNSVAKKVIPENKVNMDKITDYIFNWDEN